MGKKKTEQFAPFSCYKARFRGLFKTDSWKVTDLYSKRYENLKKDAIDPITKKTHKAKAAENNKNKPEKKPVKMFS